MKILLNLLAEYGSLKKFQSFNLFCALFLQFILFFPVKADSQSSTPKASDLASSQDVVSNFQPSLAVVIGILAIMFSLTFILLLYAKFCRNVNSSGSVHNHHIFDGLPRSRSRFSGIDKTVIESLPLFRFSSLKGSREGLECAICLSKFEDIEILRLLPKCKHAFHINCLDQWLEKHSSCPLCRFKVSPDDLSTFTYSNSLRFLWNQQELTQESSNLELYIQREESHRGSSRFSAIFAESFRKSEKDKKEDELPIQQQQSGDDDGDDGEGKVLHKFNHKIIVSDSVLMKNRWSNVSSSDLMFLKSEMLNEESSSRFSALESSNDGSKQCSTPTRMIGDGEAMNIKEEMERKREFEIKLSKLHQNDSFFPPLTNHSKASDSQRNSKMNPSHVLNPSEKRSMSEIVVHPRFSTEFEINRPGNINFDDNRGGNLAENSVKEEKMRRLWLPIARRTVQWFANRERSSTQQPQYRRESLNV
ncbi:OLC1v1037405C1 [Oldenlandia corymbosa var. corymbosa]|uniref:RING-type E3 ubiquitin transferase n=1 Tax=Oldenlandia corymbosa var. corymbosa TaxID=529605 RepID=A0AAV1D0P4_OLDCO|nr:OLC1v1037405C1 [Oldenlandia corymbosa var. corymbosa]